MIVSVALDVPAYTLFNYRAPAGENLLGRHVRVKFSGQQMIGVVMAESELTGAPGTKIKEVQGVLKDLPPLPLATLELIKFCADYYHLPIGVAVATILPAVFRRMGSFRPPATYRLVGSAISILRPRRTKARRVCYFLQNDKCATAAVIKAETGASDGILRRLVLEGVLVRDYSWPAIQHNGDPDTPPKLTPEQERAVAGVNMKKDELYLLFGDTGSGKTEVYLRLAEKALADKGQCLVLTPEIHLPQLEKSFASRFPSHRVCVFHSELTDHERSVRWLMAMSGEVDIILGTRLAVFIPMPRLRLLVVDEEHADSHKQQEGLMFSARDVAIWRGRNENIPVICGSRTPSLESYQNALCKKYTLLRMNAHPHESRLDISLTPEEGSLFHGMTQRFLAELGSALAYGRQALVFINQRDYSPMLTCSQCQWTALCRSCESRMTWHKRRDSLVCHRCGASRRQPQQCEMCGGGMKAAGIGTQSVEEALNLKFAPLLTVRLDSDSLSTRDSFNELHESVVSGETKLLVGTRPISKGYHFPHLSFIGILNSDASLWSADFRAEEHLMMMLSQVISRGTRNPEGCKILLQTAQTTHPLYRELLSNNVEQCWNRLLDDRRRGKMPPYAHCALLRASSLAEPSLHKFYDKAFLAGKRCARGREVRLFDAVPSPLVKVAKRHCWQMLIQTTSRAQLHEFLSVWRAELPNSGDVRWILDVDPLVI